MEEPERRMKDTKTSNRAERDVTEKVMAVTKHKKGDTRENKIMEDPERKMKAMITCGNDDMGEVRRGEEVAGCVYQEYG